MEDLREIAEKLEILKEDIHDNAIEHGWYDEPRTFGDMIALCHSELSEALEDFRNNHKTKEIWKDEKRQALWNTNGASRCNNKGAGYVWVLWYRHRRSNDTKARVQQV